MTGLNRKLAEWRWGKDYAWYPPNEPYYYNEPDFTHSLDVCFKWLVPKLENYFIGSSVSGHTAVVWFHGHSYQEIAGTPALALCEAVEKLIASAQYATEEV